MCDLPVYICTGCDHSIPISVVEHKAILSGLKPTPELCFDCLRVQERLADEITDEDYGR